MTASTGEATLFFGNPWGGAGNGRVRAELPSIFSRLIWASLCFCFYETDQALSTCCCEHVCGGGGCLGMAWQPFAGSCGVQPPAGESKHHLASRALWE